MKARVCQSRGRGENAWVDRRNAAADEARDES